MRYFIIFFNISYGGNPGSGSDAIESETYPNRERISEAIVEKLGVNELAISNIIELTEQDYKDWNR